MARRIAFIRLLIINKIITVKASGWGSLIHTCLFEMVGILESSVIGIISFSPLLKDLKALPIVPRVMEVSLVFFLFFEFFFCNGK